MNLCGLMCLEATYCLRPSADDERFPDQRRAKAERRAEAAPGLGQELHRARQGLPDGSAQ